MAEWKTDIQRIHFLYYFAGREEWYDTIKDTAVILLMDFAGRILSASLSGI